MRYVISATQQRHLLINVSWQFILNLIKSNRQSKLKLGVGFKAKARASAYLLNWGGDVGVFCGLGVCEGWVYMFIWLGCIRWVRMYWERGRRETTPLCHICYIKFVSLLKKFYAINLIKMTKIENKYFKCSK